MKKFWNFIAIAVFGGVFGLQEFYMNRIGLGIAAVLFWWTCIPAVIAFIEALVWLFKGEDEFNRLYGVNQNQYKNVAGNDQGAV